MKFHKGEIVRGVGEADLLDIDGKLGIVLGSLGEDEHILYLVEFYEGHPLMHNGLNHRDVDGNPLKGKDEYCWFVRECNLRNHTEYTPDMAEELL